MPVPHCLYNYSFQVSFEIGKLKCSNFIFLCQNGFGYCGSFAFPYKFRINLSISAKKHAQILIRIELNIQINLGKIAILTILTLPTHEHEMSFHLLRSSFIFLLNVRWFSVYKYCISFVKFIPKYFIFLMLLWIKLFSLFYFQIVHLLIYGNWSLHIDFVPCNLAELVYWFSVLCMYVCINRYLMDDW